MINQVLYHIHHRRIPASVVTEHNDENNSRSIKPTLSGLQFHDDLPHETVVSIVHQPRNPNCLSYSLISKNMLSVGALDWRNL